MQNTYTLIFHQARIALGLTNDEYIVADTIYHLAKSPKNKGGWTNISHQQLADLVGVTRRTIGHVLDKLVLYELIETKAERKRATQKWYDVAIMIENDETGWEKFTHQERKIIPGVGKNNSSKAKKFRTESEKISHNNNGNTDNNVYNNVIIEKASQEDEKELPITDRNLPLAFGKMPLHRLVYIYSVLWNDLYGTSFKVTNWPLLAKLYKPLIEQYTEFQIASLMILHFEWAGATGNDEFTHKRLAESFFPIEWIPKSINQYSTYLTNTLNVNFEDKAKVAKFVKGIMDPKIEDYKKDIAKKETDGETTINNG